MKILSTYYLRQEGQGSFVLLQQVIRRKGQLPLLLACIGVGNGSVGGAQELCYGLGDWFHDKCLARCMKGVIMKDMRSDIRQIIDNIQNNMADHGELTFSGVLCVGDQFMIFGKGVQKTYLLNNRFSHANIKRLAGGTDILYMREGIMQRNIGLLLATEEFCHAVDEKIIAQSLAVSENREEKQMQKRLDELGRYGAEHEGSNLGAVFLIMK